MYECFHNVVMREGIDSPLPASGLSRASNHSCSTRQKVTNQCIVEPPAKYSYFTNLTDELITP